MQVATKTYECLPKQYEFIEATEREVLYSGAFGAGKSRALCMKLVARAASSPDAREGLCRKYLVSLRHTTLRTLLEPEGGLEPVLPPGSYHYYRSQRRIKLHSGGEIIFFGLDDPEKVGSLQLTGCAVDEAHELTEDDWTMLRGRIRLEAPGLRPQLYAACNPAGPSHFLAKRFGLAPGTHPQPGCRVIQTSSFENFFLPEEYLQDLNSFTGVARARYVEGRWVASENLVYDAWDRSKFLTVRDGDIWHRIVVGVDEGFTNPTALIAVGVDGDGRAHVIAEWYRRGALQDDIIEACRRWQEAYNPERFVCDPSAAGLIAALRRAGIRAEKGNNDVMAGIRAVQSRLQVAGDGRPRLTVDPRCENLIREFETYEWLPEKDRPRKENDHALDALRYAICYLDRIGRKQARIVLL